MNGDSPQGRVGEWFLDLIRDVRLYIVLVAAVALVSVVQAHSAHNDTKKTLSGLLACTTPGLHHDCFNRSQQQTGKILQEINQSTIDAAICATRTGGSAVKIEKCVAGLLVKQGYPSPTSSQTQAH